MRCPHCGGSVLNRRPMTRAQREVYAAMVRLMERGERLGLDAVAAEADRAPSTVWEHVDALVSRGWISKGKAGRVPMSDWTLTRPLDADGIYLAHKEAA